MDTTVTSHSGWLTVGKVARVLLWLVYGWLIVNLVLLLLAFVLQLLGANPEASFVEWVYRSVQRTMAPFRGMFESVPLSDESVIDTSLLFAAIIYSLAALALRMAIDWVTERITRQPSAAPPGYRGVRPSPPGPGYPGADPSAPSAAYRGPST
jgi:uncharacterized protein YggT (Ycf19 family)